MQFDIQATIQDNVRLKKALQMSRFSNEKIQKQLKQLKQLHEECLQRNKTLKIDYCDLQRKYQQSFTQSIKDNNSLISQIQQLKKIIQEKQREMQQVQIKLIPNLDQDMLRVRLITEMQGPYQQAVDRKDRQAQKLKNKITQLQRDLQISSLSLKSKLQELSKERDCMKSRYEQQSSRLMQELDLALGRNQVQSIEGSIIKNQKKQIQELKITLQFASNNQDKHLQQIKDLKAERKHLLQKTMQLTGKQALFLQGRLTQGQIQRLREQRLRSLQQTDRLKMQNQKQLRNINKLQQQRIKMQDQRERQLNQHRDRYRQQKNQLLSQAETLRQEVRRLRNIAVDNQTDRETIYGRVRALERQLSDRNKEVDRLTLENSRYSLNRENHCDVFSRQEAFTKGNRNQPEDKENNNTTINKRRTDSSKQVDKCNKLIQQLKRENQKLRRKLAQANAKILQLIRDKMKCNQKISPQRDRTKSSIDRPLGVFLQYEDCGFQPLVQPTLFTYYQKRI